MISSIFGKTKPINFIIVLSFLFLFYWFVHFFLLEQTYEPDEMVLQIGVLALLIFSFFIVDFVTKRNKMTGGNSFTILFFAMLMVIFPETLVDNNAILCNFFLLLATRRLISLKTLKDIKLKIFDATLWIMFSSLFYDWSVLFVLAVFVAIYIYEPKSFRNWLVPFIAMFTMFMISYGFLILVNNKEFLLNHYQFNANWDLDYYLDWPNSSRLISYVIFVFLVTIYVFIKLGSSGVGKIVTTRLIILIFVLGFLVNEFASSDTVHPILITFFPAAVLMTNYIESIKRDNFKEIMLMFFIFIPFMVFLSILILK